MIKHNKKIGIFIDSRKKSGGAYQELLYNIHNIKKYNKENFKFSLICASKKYEFSVSVYSASIVTSVFQSRVQCVYLFLQLY